MVMEEVILKVRVIQEGIRDFGRGLAYNTNEMKQNLDMTKDNTRAGVRWGVNLKKMFIGLRGFRMEMLSVMFFGMGMQRFFMGLLNPALQLTGVFEVISSTLAILFLPVALKLLDWALWLSDKLLNLSPATQKWIGYLVLLGAAIGTALFFFGSFVLGIGGIIMAFGGLFSIILSLVTNPIALLLGALIGGTGLVFALNLVKTIWSSIGNVANTVFQTILSKFPAIKEKLEEWGIDTTNLGTVWDSIKNKVKEVFDDWVKEHKPLWDKFLELKDDLETMWDDFNVHLKTTLDESVKIVAEAVAKMLIELAKIPFKGYQKLGAEIADISNYARSVKNIGHMEVPGAITSPPLLPSSGVSYPEFTFPPVNITIEDKTGGAVTISSNQGTIIRGASSLSTRSGN